MTDHKDMPAPTDPASINVDITCEEDCFAAAAPLSRREFTAGTIAGAGVAAMSGSASAAMAVTETDVMIETPDGMCDAVYFHPTEGQHPGALIWTDIMGLRPAFRDMGRRLAAEGYSVLVPNPFYRTSKAPFPQAGFNFRDEDDRAMMMKVMGQLVAPGAAERDAKTFIAWLDAQDEVDSSKKMGTSGYCMGGPLTMRTAALLPKRIGAAGSFHGGGLVTDKPESPHLMIPKMEVRYHIAIAENDHERQPEAEGVLRAAFEAAGLPATVEVYEGADHGWCVPGSPVYNEPQAERAWAQLLKDFKTALA